MRPICCLLALLLTSAARGDERIPKLIAQLGSDRFEERQAATRPLDFIGKEAVPSLNRAAKTSADAEIRQRSAKLVEIIEGRLAQAQIVTLK